MSHTRPPGPEYRTGEPYLEPGRAPINTLWADDGPVELRSRAFFGSPPGLEARTGEPRQWPSHWGGRPGVSHGHWLRAWFWADLRVWDLRAYAVRAFLRTHLYIYNLSFVVGYQLFS